METGVRAFPFIGSPG